MDQNNFNLTERRKLLHERQRKRQKIFKLITLSIPLLILLITIIVIMSNRNNTVATFNLAIPKIEEKQIYTVCIDPGHGDWDYGAISPNGTAEKDITLAVSLKLGKLLEEDGSFKVIYTRATDTMDWIETANDSLKERIKISKICNADIFISIHCNYSSDSNEILGVETWYNPSDDSSLTLSKYLQQALIDLDYTTNRGVKSYVPGEELAVLELNSTTSALVELGFLTNSSDEKYLTSDIGQANCANVLYKAIVEYRDDTNE
ncbi:MAG: N-acetylmuramoyl-L-alanine amidase [Clostridium sp.]|nr:N-acetylmuramoyl-L-alanine amidase [Clostridium sp.]